VTFVRNSVGIGQARDFELPVLEIGGDEFVALSGDILFANLDFEYQQAVKEWIAARARVRVTARLGSEVSSLLASGVAASTGFELGWLIKLVRSDRAMLSANIDLSNNTSTIINILQFVDDIVEGETPQLISTTPSVRGGGGLRFAYGVSELCGLTFFGSGGYGESIDRRAENEFFLRVGGLANFDLLPGTNVPLGLSLGYVFDTFPEGGEDVASNDNTGTLRIEYTGRNDLGLGLVLTVERLNTRSVGSITVVSTSIDLRYFF
jgi:hypothetical protein